MFYYTDINSCLVYLQCHALLQNIQTNTMVEEDQQIGLRRVVLLSGTKTKSKTKYCGCGGMWA